MAAIPFRVPIVAAFLSMVLLSVLPHPGLAQLPCIEQISGTTDPANPFDLVLAQSQAQPTLVLDEAEGSAFARFFREGEWYFSWGYSRESWARTNLHVSQPSQGNNFTIYDMRGQDDATWHSIFGAQYNIRLGRFIDEERTLAVEFNFDHTKYSSVPGQTARINGTLAGQPANGNFRLEEPFFYYYLHNGVNHVMFNLVKRIHLIGEPNENYSVAAIAKAGVGFLAPHAENVIMGRVNDVGKRDFGNLVGFNRGWWQIDGFTTGIELGFRIVLVKPFYLEITDKVAFATVRDVPVYQGTARHNLWMNEVIVSIGFTFGGR